jgi:hypothetical protein
MLAAGSVLLLLLLAVGFVFQLLFKIVLFPLKIVGGLVLGVLALLFALPLLVVVVPIVVIALPAILVATLVGGMLFVAFGVFWLGAQAFALVF